MSFTDPLSIFHPLPESNDLLSRSLSTSSVRTLPKSYHPTPPSRRGSVSSRRGSISSSHRPRASLDLPSISISDDPPTPIRSPPPAYVHIPPHTQETTPPPRSQRNHDHPPPAYWNNLPTSNTRPRRSSSCSARFSTDAPPLSRRLTYTRRISSAPSASLSPPREPESRSNRRSVALNRHSMISNISPIEQSPSSPQLPEYGSIPIRLVASYSSSFGDPTEDDDAESTSSFETARSSAPPSPPSRFPPWPPSSTSSTLISTPPVPRPSMSGSRFTESAEDLEGSKDWSEQEEQWESEGSWCCGVFWVEGVGANDRRRIREKEVERLEMRREGGNGYLGGCVI